MDIVKGKTMSWVVFSPRSLSNVNGAPSPLAMRRRLYVETEESSFGCGREIDLGYQILWYVGICSLSLCSVYGFLEVYYWFVTKWQ